MESQKEEKYSLELSVRSIQCFDIFLEERMKNEEKEEEKNDELQIVSIVNRFDVDISFLLHKILEDFLFLFHFVLNVVEEWIIDFRTKSLGVISSESSEKECVTSLIVPFNVEFSIFCEDSIERR